jgi:hypothetical protein
MTRLWIHLNCMIICNMIQCPLTAGSNRDCVHGRSHVTNDVKSVGLFDCWIAGMGQMLEKLLAGRHYNLWPMISEHQPGMDECWNEGWSRNDGGQSARDEATVRACQEKVVVVVNAIWSEMWSSGQCSWLQIQRSGFDSRRCRIFWVVVLEHGPLSLVSVIEELLVRKSSGSSL